MIRVGIVGLGSMGRRHLEIYESLDQVEVVALCDVNADALSSYSAYSCYTDFNEMLTSSKIDLLSVVTTGPYHCQLVIDAAKSGVKCILCEKPIATSIEDARRMIETCKEHDTLLAINHSRRWSFSYQEIQRLLRAGVIGDLRHIHTTLGGGRLGAMGTHMFDVWRMLFESEADWVFGRLDTSYGGDHKGRLNIFDPGGYGVVHFSNGGRATLDISEDLGVPEQLILTGSIGRIVIDEGAHRCTISARQGEDREKRLGCFDLALHDQEISFEPLDIVALTKQAILDLIEGKVVCNGEDGLRALEICLAFHLSDKNESKISLPLANTDTSFKVNIT